jgi:signal transduction histidine kinase
MSWRLRSVRKRILVLALVPVLSLLGLYVFTTTITARNAIVLARTQTLKNGAGQPTGTFEAALQAERLYAALYLSAPTPSNLATLNAMAKRTSHEAAGLRAALTSDVTMGSATAPEKQAIATLLAAVQTLPALRGQVAAGTIDRSAALASYNTIVNDVDQFLNQLIRQETNATIVAQGLAFVRIARTGDILGQESALLLGDLESGSFPPADRRQFTELVGARRTLAAVTLPDLDPTYRAYYTRYVSPQASATLTAMENKVMSTVGPRGLPPVSPLAWERAVGAVAPGFTKAGTLAGNAITQQASNAAWSTYLQLIVTGGIGLLLMLLSIIVAILTSRSLVRELTGLRQSALALANERLPEVVDRLALGQDVDVSAETPGIPASTDEIGQVRDAFAAVQQTAVRAAVGQARLRQGMSEVFRNLARRSQSLLHRQLALLDAMERRARDPQELEDLFRIDHLTTRMRRHAESLIILSGHAPARGWRNPVPLVDVLRGAVAEVEDYTRIRATSATAASLAGPAVGDVIHLIAELAENATMFSPPNTPVVIHGDIVGKGFAVDIEDRGLGLSDERLEHVNELLANPPPFDPSGSDQLGLFVAGQLAKRHNIKITLRPSPYGGITAIVLIPQNLVVAEDSHARDLSTLAVTDGTPRFKGRHAGLDWAKPAGDAGPEPAAPVPAATAALPEAVVPAMRDPADTADLTAVSLGQPRFPGPGLSPGDTALGGTARDDDFGGLPRRIRQASLAPRLRESTAESAQASGGDDLWVRSPEDTRSTMTAIQQGWERGRSVFDAPSASTEPASPASASTEPASPAPASTEPASPEPASRAPADPEPVGTVPPASPVPVGTVPPASPVPGPGYGADNGSAEAGNGSAATPGPGAETAGGHQAEGATEDGGTSG